MNLSSVWPLFPTQSLTRFFKAWAAPLPYAMRNAAVSAYRDVPKGTMDKDWLHRQELWEYRNQNDLNL